MTVAICIRCGAEKHGALTPCGACGWRPRSAEEQAQAMALSDDHQTSAELRAIGDRIQAGETPEFDDVSIRELAAFICEISDPGAIPLGCRIAVWIPIVVVAALAAVLVVSSPIPYGPGRQTKPSLESRQMRRLAGSAAQLA